MAETLQVEILDQTWTRKAFTDGMVSIRITEELGQVGEADIELPVDDPAVSFLPDPDAANPYEGRVRIYEDGALAFAGVIDAKSTHLSNNGASVKFGGKGRGIELSFVNTGRIDFIAWPMPAVFEELLRNNIAKESVLVSVSSQDELYGAYQLTTGDPFKQNYWKSAVGTGTHTATFDLGSVRQVSGMRAFPQWWKDIDTLKFHYHNFTMETSVDGTNWTLRYTKDNNYASTSRGHLVTFTPTDVRYWRINVTGSTDGFARIAQVFVYTNIATVGSETTYNTPFIENDDSGNCTTAGSVTRPIVPGAFQGDGVITHSYVTKLAAGGSITHTFRGTQDAVYFTSATNGSGVAKIIVDGVDRGNVSIPNNKYWFKGYDTADDLGELSNGVHTLKVEYVSGSVQVDYFNGIYATSWRPIEDDDSSIGYLGNWSSAEAAYFHNYFAAQSETVGNEMFYYFTGDRIRVIGSKANGFGSFTWSVDGVPDAVVNCNNGSTQTNKQVLLDWSGAYGSHRLRIAHSAAGKILIDRLEGNLTHTLYIRARYETNLKVLIRTTEIMDSWARFNPDGTVDLLGSVGSYGGTVIREGEHEGGAIVSANVSNDYSETGSAVLAIVNVNGEMPIKAFVIDKEAVEEIGFKVVKLEQSDAADQFLLNRQALQYLRERRKPTRSYEMTFHEDDIGGIAVVGETTRLYSPTAGLDGETRHRIGRVTKEYVRD